RTAPRSLIGVLPDRIARRDHRHIHSPPVFHPERFSRPTLIRRILKNQNPQQSLRLAREHFIRLARLGRIHFHHIKSNHRCVIHLHHLPSPPRLPRQQLPTVRPLLPKQIRIVIPATPFDERI